MDDVEALGPHQPPQLAQRGIVPPGSDLAHEIVQQVHLAAGGQARRESVGPRGDVHVVAAGQLPTDGVVEVALRSTKAMASRDVQNLYARRRAADEPLCPRSWTSSGTTLRPQARGATPQLRLEP